MKISLHKYIIPFLASMAATFSVSADTVDYSITFTDAPNDWTIINEQSPDYTWKYFAKAIYVRGQYYAGIRLNPDPTGAENVDCYVSPAFKLEAGEYTVKYTTGQSGSDASLNLLLSESATDVQGATLLREIKLYETPSTSTSQLVVTAPGTYYFAFQGSQGETIPYGPTPAYPVLIDFSIQGEGSGTTEPPVEEQETFPYAIDFTTTYNNWTVRDYNGDNVTWYLYEKMGMAVDMSWTDGTDDSLMSPALTLEEGNSYKIVTKTQGMCDESLVLSLYAVNASGEKTVISSGLKLPSTGVETAENFFVPSETGEYQFEYHLYAPTYNYSMLYLMSCEISDEGAAVVDPLIGTEVFNLDPTADDVMNGWTVLDLNNDAMTWKPGTSPAGIAYNGVAASGKANDMLICPALSLANTVDYTVSYTLNQSSAFDPDMVMVLFGTEPTAEAMTTVLKTENIYLPNGAGNYSSICRVAPEHAGNGYIGFLISTPDANGKLTLTKFTVTAVGRPTPQPLANFDATSNFDSKTVTCTWTAPSFDTENVAINQPITILIYHNNLLVGTVEAQNAGEAGTYTYSPDTFEGYATVSACAMLGENKSAKSSTTINLDDIQGDCTLVKAFPISRSDFAAWATESIQGTGTWGFGYSDVIQFNYAMGQIENDWLISPAVELATGKRYVVKYMLQTQLNYGSTIAVTIGSEQTSEAQTQVLREHEMLEQNGMGEFETPQFTVAESGSHYVGFHLTQTECSTKLSNVAVYRLDPSGVEVPVSAAVAFERATGTLLLPEGASVAVFDTNGRLVANTTNLSGLAKGIYIVRVAKADGTIQLLKIAK